ncbi:MAG: hypothetical protein CFE43_19530 [Burkholderiales bacterium PBB3]|nr:MAG: hypothetical protein CFE43_19530 [Burkholderiales bacterium PBB3]
MKSRTRCRFLQVCIALGALQLGWANAAVLITDKVLPWPGGVVHWAYNPAGQPSLQTTEAWVDTMTDTMARWQAVCQVQFVYDGLTAQTTADGSAMRAVVQWDASQTASGRTMSMDAIFGVQTTGIRLRDYSLESFYTDGYAKYVDFFQGMFLHEVGHLLGLGHSDRPGSILYANPYHPERGYMRNLKGDDIAACAAIYGAKGKLSTALANPVQAVRAEPVLLAGESVRIVVTDAVSGAQDPTTFTHLPTVPADSTRIFIAVQFALAQATLRQRIELIAPDGSLYDYIEYTKPIGARGWTWYDIPAWTSYGALTLPGTWKAHFLVGGQVKATQSFEVPVSRGSLAQLPEPLVNLHPRDDGGVNAGIRLVSGAPLKSANWRDNDSGTFLDGTGVVLPARAGVRQAQARMTSASPRYVTASNGFAQEPGADIVRNLRWSAADWDGAWRASGEVLGSADSAVLWADMLLPRNLAGSQKLYIVAVAGGSQVFIKGAQGWQAWDGNVNSISAWTQVTAPILASFPVINYVDLNALPRPLQFYVGFGSSAAAMVQAQTFVPLASF